MATKKQSQRSPTYPVLGLGATIKKLEDYYKKEGQNVVPRNAAIEAMGYSSVSGQSLQALSTMSQYGLLEKVGAGKVKISDLGLKLMVGTSSESEEALLSAAKSPPIFEELLLQFEKNKPSERTLLSYLIQRKPKGYVERSANKIARAFFETIEVANLYGRDYHVVIDDGIGVNDAISNDIDKQPSDQGKKQRRMKQEGSDQAVLPLPEGDVILDLPQDLSENSAKVIKTWFDLVLSLKQPTIKIENNTQEKDSATE